jgi:hypothetical protein
VAQGDVDLIRPIYDKVVKLVIFARRENAIASVRAARSKESGPVT